MLDHLTPRQRSTYSILIIGIAVVNVLDLTGVWRQPAPIPAALFALNTVLLVRLVRARRRARTVIVIVLPPQRSNGGQ